MTDNEKATEVFYATIRSKYPIPDDLVLQWYMMAVADYELDIGPLQYDGQNNLINSSYTVINTIGLIMSKYYVKRELSRINKLDSVIGKDIQLNSTGVAKKAVKSEYDGILEEIEAKLHKQKRHAFN